MVDDERAQLDSVKRAFKPFGGAVEITTTTSGVDALLVLAELKPHGLLLDLNMPDLDGLEVCRRIQARKQFESLRVIMMTAKHTSAIEEEARKAGAEACLAKPIDAEHVLKLTRSGPQARAR